MAIWERFGSRRTSKDSGQASQEDRIYIVEGTTDEEIAINTIEAFAPVLLAGPPLLKLSNIGVEQIGPYLWEGTVRYIDPRKKNEKEELDTGSIKFSFDTTGGTVHVTQSLETKSRTPSAGNTAPDFKGAIGVNKDQVSGVDITIPSLRFQLTYKHPAANVDLAFAKKLSDLTGSTNDATFKGFPAGELLFLGAVGQESTDTDADPEVTYHFDAKPNVTNLDVGSIVVPAKLGHEYLWLFYREEEDGTAELLVPRALAAYVERVYEKDDFSKLGIGT